MLFSPTRPLTLLLASACSLSAVELTDLAGDWTIADFCSPIVLQEEYYNDLTLTTRTSENSCDFAGENEVLKDVFYPVTHSTELRSMSLSPTGVVSGQESGQVLSISQNRLLYSDGTDPVTVFSNTTGEIMLTSCTTDEFLEQSILLKRPATLTTAELEGAWFIVDMINPTDITKTFGGGNLTNVDFEADSSLAFGDINIDGVGGFTGIFSGTISGSGPGNITVNADGVIPFKTNASKNIAVATPGDVDESEYIVLVKKPTTLTTAELAGTWRVSALRVPSTLTERFLDTNTSTFRDADSSSDPGPNEFVVDVYHEDKFDLVRLQLQVAADGTLANGSLTANGGAKTVTFNYDGDSILMHPNADKTFMVGTVIEPDSHELIVFIKTSETAPDTFEETTDLKTVSSNSSFTLSWNGATNLILQESTAPLSGWTTVEEASGSDAFTADLTGGGKRFFRVSEAP